MPPVDQLRPKPCPGCGHEAELEELAEIKETYANILAERCAGDEQHCPCVPALRGEIARLTGLLDTERHRAEEMLGKLALRAGADPAEWPEDLRVWEVPGAQDTGGKG